MNNTIEKSIETVTRGYDHNCWPVYEVKELVSKMLAVDISEVTPEAELEDDLGADSLDAVEVIMAVEERYGIQIRDDELNDIITVRDLIDIVYTRTEPRRGTQGWDDMGQEK